MKIIDAQTYIGDSVYFKRRFTAEKLIERMDKNNIDKAVVTAPPPGPDYKRANRKVCEAVKKYPDRLIGFYHINPWYGEKEIERARRAVEKWGFRGFKLDPRNDSFYIIPMLRYQKMIKPIMKMAEKLQVPVFIHLDETIDIDFCTPEAIALLASSNPNVKIITRRTYVGVSLASRFPISKKLGNLYFTTYPLIGGHKGVDILLKEMVKMNPKRIVFASEMPFGHPEFELRTIELTGLSEEVKNLILSKNIRRILEV